MRIFIIFLLAIITILAANLVIKSNDIICVIEDHSIIGGLSSIVKQLAFDYQIYKDMCFFSLKDKFLNEYSNQENLLKKHGISTNIIFYKIKKLINDKKNKLSSKKTSIN